MPKELRKRGKKKSKKVHEDAQPTRHEPIPEPEETAAAGPSWILPAVKTDDIQNSEAPFGYVDADVKAYFRTVDTQLREWQENSDNNLDGEDDSVNSNDGMLMKLLEY
jgi:nucleolar protein 9